MNQQPPPGDSLTADLGIDAYRDAIAAVRACASEDHQGLYAVLDGTDAPRHVAAALVTLVVMVCRRCGLDNVQITALMSEMTTDIFDAILDTLAVRSPGPVTDA